MGAHRPAAHRDAMQLPLGVSDSSRSSQKQHPTVMQSSSSSSNGSCTVAAA